MTVTAVRKDTDAATMVVTAEFDADTDRVWQLWQDPRLLERWWGPPTYPATVVEHDLSPGGTVTYFMTAPDGERYHGLWRIVEVDAPTRLVFQDSFADADGQIDATKPTTTTTVTIAARDGGGTTMTLHSDFPSTEAMEQLLEMGMDEGLRGSMGQIDALLAS